MTLTQKPLIFVLLREDSGYYDCDGIGNVTGLFETNLNQVAYYLYDPFGNTIFASGPMAPVNPYRFSSKEFHANSGSIYFGRRFYDPTLQRFINQDPIQELGGVNLYTFVANTPVNAVDPLGQFLLFDRQAWGRLLYDTLIGDGSANIDPNSNLAQRQAEGVGVTQ